MRDVGDRGRLGDADAEHPARRARRAGPDADEHAGGAGAHQVQARVVGGAAADDDGHVQGGDELLEVERLGDGGDVFAGDDGALDHEHVEAGLERDLVVAQHPLGGERGGDDHLLRTDLLDALRDQLLLDGLAVDLLHFARGLLARQRGDPLQLLLGVLVAGEDALQVEHGESAEPPDDARGLGGDDAVHRGGHHRQLELVGPELPGDVDVVGVTRAPRGHDRDVVEAVRPAALLAPSDVDLHCCMMAAHADGRGVVGGKEGRTRGNPGATSAVRGPGILACVGAQTPPPPSGAGRKPPPYEPGELERRRQEAWAQADAFRAPPVEEGAKGIYIKASAPFTSGNVHIGHVRSYAIGDAYARFQRARGEPVLFAFGFDAFGLPAELGAIAGGTSPAEWVERCAQHMTGQLQRLGFSFDWERTFMSSDAVMYRWSQWLFLTLAEAGLIYHGSGTVDWCDTCQTVLASIQVENGTCWRCHNPVRLVQRAQWYLGMSAYLEENDRRVGELRHWDETSLASQRDVLGRVDGVEVSAAAPDGAELVVFTPHPDALGGARFVLVSPKHPEVERWTADPAVERQLEETRLGGWERSARGAETVVLVDTGRTVALPGGPQLPVYVSPAVDERFGATAVVGVPEHDRTDETIAERLGHRRPRRPPPSRPAPGRPCGTRRTTSRSPASARGARRSRSSTASAAAPCPCPRSSCRWSCRAT